MSKRKINSNNKSNKNTRYSYIPVMGGAASQLGFSSIGYPKTKQARKEDASFLSAIGNAVGNYVPVVGKPLALVASIPDTLYDLEDLYKRPSWEGLGHTILDGINRYSTWTATRADDAVGALGVMDDALQSNGVDVFNWLDNLFKSPSKNKNKNKGRKK